MAKYATITALLIVLLGIPEIAAGQVCTISYPKGAPLIKPGKMGEFYTLLQNNLKEEAFAEDVACLVPVGTKVIITDWGFASSTVRVLDGPEKGCVGDIAAEFYHCAPS